MLSGYPPARRGIPDVRVRASAHRVTIAAMKALIAGATGFVGSRLAPALLLDGQDVRCMVRDPASDRAAALAAQGCDILVADLTEEEGLDAALDDVEVAYFLVHMMGRMADYAEAEHEAARRFGERASAAGVRQVVYLGGLGADPASPHLRSRHETALALRAGGPPLTYFRAAMVVGSGSESYVLVRDIAERLPALPDARWMRTLTQPIGIRDVIGYLRRAPFVKGARGRDIEIGGPEVLTPLEVVDRTALALGRRPPRRLPPIGATPGAVAAGAEAVTSGHGAIAAELALGLGSDTIVTDPSGAELFDLRPEPLDVALQRAIEEDEQMALASGG
jgi:uncharacterized protein YbjT (DUF2867 family)